MTRLYSVCILMNRNVISHVNVTVLEISYLNFQEFKEKRLAVFLRLTL